MSEIQLDSKKQAYGPGLPTEKSGRNFGRRRFLGGMALASLTAPFLGTTAAAMAAPEGRNLGDSREKYLNVYRFGARGNGRADDTAAIQKALDTAGKQGGNVVLLPRGEYLVRGSLHVPDDVTLQGVFRAPNRGNTGQNKGSLLLATGGKGKPDGTPFITLGENGTLYGLTVFYPEQTCPNPPVEYPWTVRQLSDNGSLVNVTLLNPWQGVDCGTVTGGRHYIHGLYGQPLKTGLFIDKCEDVGRVEDVHFWPFWKADAPTMAFTSQEATAFRIGRTDWEYMFNCFAICHKIGYHFVRTPSGEPNVVLTQCGSDEGAPNTKSVSVQVDGNQAHAGISFVNGQFMGAPSIAIGKTNAGPVKFTNCGFWGGPLTDTMAILEGSGQTSFTGCHFISWAQQHNQSPAIRLRRGGLTVNGCEFMDTGSRQVGIEKLAASAVIVGNRMRGPVRINNQIGTKAQIGLNAAG